MKREPTIVSDPIAVRAACDSARAAGNRVALVPTMGALHQGHLSLVEEAAARSDFVVVSIFVNPTQFGQGEDLDVYPHNLEGDTEKLSRLGVNLIFTPSVDDMYRPSFSTKVVVGCLTKGLCGASREGHFEGVTTVVSKLFNIVGPSIAVFGRKDYQQLKVIKRMVCDLNMPIEIIGMPTYREPDGLAMSSRNTFLSKDGRERALTLSRGLAQAHCLYKDGERRVGALRRAVAETVETVVDSIDYITAADPDTLVPLTDDAAVSDKLLIAVAVMVGSTRLIDNTVLGEDTFIIL